MLITVIYLVLNMCQVIYHLPEDWKDSRNQITWFTMVLTWVYPSLGNMPFLSSWFIYVLYLEFENKGENFLGQV